MMRHKSPPQVETEVSRIRFQIRQVMRPHDGFFMHYLTNFHHAFVSKGLGYFNLFICTKIISQK